MVYVDNFLAKSNILVCIIKRLTEGWQWHPETSEITELCSAQKISEAPLISAQLQQKTLYSVPIACQCMIANCGANAHRLLW